MTTRKATHAGSWYSSSKPQLDSQLTGWLAAVQPTADQSLELPVQGCKAIIAPHAGYSYSGPPAAWAYRCVDTAIITRVFVLGPSHHVYLDGCALSKCDEYATPLGNLKLDKKTIAELEKTGKFEKMDIRTDEDEHSIEMHLPYVRKIFEGREDVSIVPILVGSISTSKERTFGTLLAPYLADPATLFVVSSDFCHWGSRFSYTFYLPPSSTAPTSLPNDEKSAAQALQEATGDGYSISRTLQPLPGHPIHASISTLDHLGMDAISFSSPSKSATTAHAEFAAYLKATKNTICGRHPIGVLLGALSALEGKEGWGKAKLEWTRYEQSSKVQEAKDSSVSYGSGYVSL